MPVWIQVGFKKGIVCCAPKELLKQKGGFVMKKAIILLLVALSLAGCADGGPFGAPKVEWNLKKYDYAQLIGVSGLIINSGSRQLGIGSLVAYAMDGDSVIGTTYKPVGTLVQPHETYYASVLFNKRDVSNTTHIKVVISNSVTDPYAHLTERSIIVSLE